MYLPQTAYQLLPRDSSLVIWFSLDMIFGVSSTLPSSNAIITSVNDGSGNNNIVTGITGVTRPTFQNSVVGGKPVLRDDGTQFLIANTLSSATAALQNCSGVTVFSVQSATAGGTAHVGTIVSVSTNGSAVNNRMTLRSAINNTSYQFILSNDDVANTVLSTSAAPTGAFEYTTAMWTASTTTALIRVGGVQTAINSSYGTSSNTLNSTSLSYALSGRTSGSAFIGDIAEVLVYRRSLSDLEILSVELYLKNKYGL